MADDEPKGNPASIALALIIFLGVVAIGWFMFGGYKNADLSGYFFAPPTAPQINSGTGIIQGPQVTPPTHPNATSTPRL